MTHSLRGGHDEPTALHHDDGGDGARRRVVPAVLRAAAPIKIGILLPFSKAFAVLGENTYAGFMLGAKEAGPEIAGRSYTIVKEDDTADPSVGVSKVRKLIEKDDVDVIVGHHPQRRGGGHPEPHRGRQAPLAQPHRHQ